MKNHASSEDIKKEIQKEVPQLTNEVLELLYKYVGARRNEYNNKIKTEIVKVNGKPFGISSVIDYNWE